ncbi:MAG: DEAD/DEAH box helicase [Phycisphaerales bacterium]|nr:DEAD/DEAH box helicase [Phycisphaerales bacterium]
MNFTELRLAEPIVRAVLDRGYSTPTPIQAQAIPVAIEGRDILGCAQTGTGKTCAFALPILHRLSDSKAGRGKSRGSHQSRAPRALILCPTRELAMQIFDSFVGYGKHLKLRHSVVFGGVSQGKQVRELRAGVDVLIATPGRLLDLINQGHIDLSKIETLVLDEADRMLDMGFITDIRKVVDMLPPEGQTLFFSATVSSEIRKLASSILHEPVRIETAPESSTVDAISQKIYFVDRDRKPELLQRLLSEQEVGRSLVFSRTKYGADKLVKMLRRFNMDAEAIHGDKTQNARTRAMRRFKSGSTKILVATDIASRGIDVDEITHVVNFDMPIDPETYVHRIGRTARAGATGVAISMCDMSEVGIYQSIIRRTEAKIEVAEDHEDLTFEAPSPSRRSRYNTNHGSRGSGPRSNHRNRNSRSRSRFNSDQPRDDRRSNSRSSNRSDSPKRSDISDRSDRPDFSKKSSSSKRSSAPSARVNRDYTPNKEFEVKPQASSGTAKPKSKKSNNRKKQGEKSSQAPHPMKSSSNKPRKPKKGNGYPRSGPKTEARSGNSSSSRNMKPGTGAKRTVTK